MKSISINLLLIFLIACVVGCEKEKSIVDVSKEGAAKGVGFGEILADGLSIYALPTAGIVEDSLKVFMSGGNAGSATEVSIQQDNSIVDEYNEINGTTLEYAPDGLYTLPASITIPANASAGAAKASFDITQLFAHGFVFAVGLKISGVSGGSNYALATQSKIIYIITIQNAYDADYTVKGYFVHPSSPRAISDVKHITTVSDIRCLAPHSDLYTSDYYFEFDVSSENTLVNYNASGATPAVPASGFMTVDNPTGSATYPGPPYVSSTYNNTYDPAEQTFWMHYGYGVGTSNQNSYSREVYEKWTRN